MSKADHGPAATSSFGLGEADRVNNKPRLVMKFLARENINVRLRLSTVHASIVPPTNMEPRPSRTWWLTALIAVSFSLGLGLGLSFSHLTNYVQNLFRRVTVRKLPDAQPPRVESIQQRFDRLYFRRTPGRHCD